jgi:nucleoside-diphosphate-sugar epimerase
MATRAFVTGGSGFVGRALIQTLVKDGVDVTAIARSDSAADAVQKAGAKPARGDLNDVSAMKAGMSGVDVVYHAAAHTQEWGTLEEFRKVNVEGTRNVIEAARAAGVKRLVHFSTEASLCGGDPMVQLDENTPYPRKFAGLYAQTKAEAEQVVRSGSGGGLECIVIRPRLIWGPNDTSLLPKIVDAVKTGRFMWVGGGRCLTSTCHVENAIHGARLAAEKGKPNEVYFITDGPPVEMRKFLSDLLRTRGVEPPTKEMPLGLAKIAGALSETAWKTLRLKGAPPVTRIGVALLFQEVTVVDAKARKELGYVEKISREEGLKALA